MILSIALLIFSPSHPRCHPSSSITSEDSSIEAYLEDLNVKFYERLNESNDKDISTEFASEESDSSDGSSHKIYVKNFIN